MDKSEELNRVINTLIAIKDEDEFYIKAYAEELIKEYAKVCVIEELEGIIKDKRVDWVESNGYPLWSDIEDRIKELKQE